MDLLTLVGLFTLVSLADAALCCLALGVWTVVGVKL